MANTRRGASTVLGVMLLVALAIVASTIVAGYSFGILDDVLGVETPQAAYEFDYDAERGLVEVTHVGGDTFEGTDLDSLYVTVSSAAGTERFAWGTLYGDGDGVSSGDSITIDDANGADEGAFTFSGRYETDTVVRIVYEGRSESYILGAYQVSGASRTYLRWEVPTNGLAAHYPLDETDPVAADAVGTGDGTIRGDPTRGVSGQVGTAYEFDGTGDYLALDRAYTGAGAVEQFTACAWFSTDETGTGEFDNWALLDFDRSEYFNLYVRGDTGAVGFSTSGQSRQTVDHSTSAGYADGNWHLACATYNTTSERKRIYVDGDLKIDAEAENLGGLGTGTTRYGFIGDGSEAGVFDGSRNDRYFTGRIDDVRLYDTALGESEIEALYDAGTGTGTAPNDGLVNHWRLDESGGSSNAVRDVAGSGDGVVVGSNTGRGVEGRVGTAYEFNDGSGYVALDRAFASEDIGNVTACAWFRTDETDGSQNWALLDFDRSEYFNLYVEGNGDIGWSTSAIPGYGASEVDDLYANGGYNDGNWHHVCGAYDGDKRIIVDGAERATRASPHGTEGLGTGTVRYGLIGDGSESDDYTAVTDPESDEERNGYYYDGTVDDVRLYERGLSTTEAARLWAFTGGATSAFETEARAFPATVDLTDLRLDRIEATRPAGTSVVVEVRADTDGDGTCDAASDPVTLNGSASYDVTGLSGTGERVCLGVEFTASGGTTPTVEGIELTAG